MIDASPSSPTPPPQVEGCCLLSLSTISAHDCITSLLDIPLDTVRTSRYPDMRCDAYQHSSPACATSPSSSSTVTVTGDRCFFDAALWPLLQQPLLSQDLHVIALAVSSIVSDLTQMVELVTNITIAKLVQPGQGYSSPRTVAEYSVKS